MLAEELGRYRKGIGNGEGLISGSVPYSEVLDPPPQDDVLCNLSVGLSHSGSESHAVFINFDSKYSCKAYIW